MKSVSTVVYLHVKVYVLIARIAATNAVRNARKQSSDPKVYNLFSLNLPNFLIRL